METAAAYCTISTRTVKRTGSTWCTLYNIQCIHCTMYTVQCTLYMVNNVQCTPRPVRSIQFVILHIKYNTYLYFSIICVNNFYKKIVTFGHEAFKV